MLCNPPQCSLMLPIHAWDLLLRIIQVLHDIIMKHLYVSLISSCLVLSSCIYNFSLILSYDSCHMSLLDKKRPLPSFASDRLCLVCNFVLRDALLDLCFIRDSRRENEFKLTFRFFDTRFTLKVWTGTKGQGLATATHTWHPISDLWPELEKQQQQDNSINRTTTTVPLLQSWSTTISATATTTSTIPGMESMKVTDKQLQDQLLWIPSWMKMSRRNESKDYSLTHL